MREDTLWERVISCDAHIPRGGLDNIGPLLYLEIAALGLDPSDALCLAGSTYWPFGLILPSGVVVGLFVCLSVCLPAAQRARE